MTSKNIDERMLNRQTKPTFDDLINHCGESGNTWTELNKHLKGEHRAMGIICFPYGTEGWCVRYSRKNKKICDIFAEDGAFTLQFRIINDAINAIYNELSEYAKEVWDNRHPCKNGNESWIHFRVNNVEHLHDVIKTIRAKLSVRL